MSKLLWMLLVIGSARVPMVLFSCTSSRATSTLLIAGAVGGNAAGAASKDISLGTLGNTIAGAVGGVGGGQLLSALIPMMAGAGNNVDIGALASQAVGGGVAGAIVAGVVGLIKNKMAS